MTGSAPPFEIRRARPNGLQIVRSLIVESMGHWDRSPAYLAEAAELMSLDADDLARDEAFVLIERMGGRVIGTEPSGIAGDDPLTLMKLPLTAAVARFP